MAGSATARRAVGPFVYYHAFQVLDFINLPALGLGGRKLDYGRAAAGVVFKF